MGSDRADVRGYARYPVANLLIYNGVTALHYLLGGFGIVLGYRPSWIAWLAAILYILFAFGQMYVLMPLSVCPNCLYYRLKDSLCVSGLNVVSRKIAGPGNQGHFMSRAKGLLCHNHLYMAAKILPIAAMIPPLAFNFSVLLLALLLAVIGLLLLRIFYIFPKVACGYCLARNLCPNAQAMGLSTNSASTQSLHLQ